MGQYTELILGCALVKETPQILIQSLNDIINGGDCPANDINRGEIKQTYSEKELDKFEDKHNLRSILLSSSYYFGCSTVTHNFYYDTIDDSYVLSTRSNSKDSGGIRDFIKYIKSYVKQGSGFEHDIFAIVQYEEDEYPTLYGTDGVYHYLDPNIEKTFTERYDKQLDVFNRLYKEILPDYKLTEEMAKEKGYDPNNMTTSDIYACAVDDMIEEIKRLKENKTI